MFTAAVVPTLVVISALALQRDSLRSEACLTALFAGWTDQPGELDPWNSNVPPSIPPPSQSKTEIRLGLVKALFWDGGGREGGTFSVYDRLASLVLDLSNFPVVLAAFVLAPFSASYGLKNHSGCGESSSSCLIL